MENTTELFNLALKQCNEINDDLDQQGEKINGIKIKLVEQNDLLDCNSHLIGNLNQKTSIRKVYLTLFTILFVFCTAIFTFKIGISRESKGKGRVDPKIEFKSENSNK